MLQGGAMVYKRVLGYIGLNNELEQDPEAC